MTKRLWLVAFLTAACPTNTTKTDGTDSGTGSPTDGGGGGGGGGGLSEEEFAEAFSRALCDKFFECMGETTLGFMGWSSVEDCYESGGMTTGTMTPPTGTGCANYDADAAQACLDAFEALTCDGFSSGEDTLPECTEEAICGT